MSGIQCKSVYSSCVFWGPASFLGFGLKKGSRKAINSFVEKTEIETKAAHYLTAGTNLLTALRIKADEIERTEYINNSDPLISQIRLKSSIDVDLSSFNDTSIKDNNQVEHFYDDHNDSKVYNLLLSLKILKEIKHVDKDVDFKKKIYL